MKKSLLVYLLAMLSITGFGQVHFGIKGGFNLANLHVSATQGGLTASTNGNDIPSFHIGGFAIIPVSENIDFRPELLLSGKGSNIPGTDDMGNTATAKFRPYYLDIPLNVVYKSKVKGGNTFFVGAGPQFGIGLFGQASSPTESVDIFQPGGFTKFDFGINFITGIELKSGIMLSANYDVGVISVIDDGGAQNPYDEKIMNRVISFSVGYIFDKGRK